MIRSKDLTGISVMERMSGRRLGKVVDVDYRPGEKWLRGLVVETQGLRQRKRYLRREDIWLLGSHVVLASGDLHVLPGQRRMYRDVYTPDGQLWGSINSLWIDPATGQITQAEVRISLLEDLTQGCRLVRASEELAVRGDRVLYQPPEKVSAERM